MVLDRYTPTEIADGEAALAQVLAFMKKHGLTGQPPFGACLDDRWKYFGPQGFCRDRAQRRLGGRRTAADRTGRFSRRYGYARISPLSNIRPGLCGRYDDLGPAPCSRARSDPLRGLKLLHCRHRFGSARCVAKACEKAKKPRTILL